MKNPEHKDPHEILGRIKELENMAGMPAFDLEAREDIKVNIRVNETIAPAMFKADPLIPGGYVANSLTIRAMRPDIFVLGGNMDDLASNYECACGKELDIQFWKLCPYCGRDFHF